MLSLALRSTKAKLITERQLAVIVTEHECQPHDAQLSHTCYSCLQMMSSLNVLMEKLVCSLQLLLLLIMLSLLSLQLILKLYNGTV